jgi:3-oxoadipate enol-lactonase
MWNDRIGLVKHSGMINLAVATLERWFTAAYRESHVVEMEHIRQMIAATDPEGYCACCAVLRDADLTGSIGSIQTPTLVIAGTHDPATPPSAGRAIAAKVPGAEYLELDASHLSAWEQSSEFAGAVVEFLTQGVKRNG